MKTRPAVEVLPAPDAMRHGPRAHDSACTLSVGTRPKRLRCLPPPVSFGYSSGMGRYRSRKTLARQPGVEQELLPPVGLARTSQPPFRRVPPSASPRTATVSPVRRRCEGGILLFLDPGVLVLLGSSLWTDSPSEAPLESNGASAEPSGGFAKTRYRCLRLRRKICRETSVSMH